MMKEDENSSKRSASSDLSVGLETSLCSVIFRSFFTILAARSGCLSEMR